MSAMCASTHTCLGDRQGTCTRLIHNGFHNCSWCGHRWADEPAEVNR